MMEKARKKFTKIENEKQKNVIEKFLYNEVIHFIHLSNLKQNQNYYILPGFHL